jgi:hypothetical protein
VTSRICGKSQTFGTGASPGVTTVKYCSSTCFATWKVTLLHAAVLQLVEFMAPGVADQGRDVGQGGEVLGREHEPCSLR